MAIRMDEIRELVRLIDESNITEFEVHHDNTKLTIKKNQETRVQVAELSPVHTKQTAAAETVSVETGNRPSVEEREEDTNLHQIVSPMVGTFYRAPSPESDPYVNEGSTVKSDSVVCILEAMKLMNEIEAEVQGTIVKILVENGQLVEYGQPLFLVKTA